MSSGVDSTLIASLLNKENRQKINTITAVFDSGKNNESKIAKYHSKKLGIKHNSLNINSLSVERSIRRLLHSYGEPFGDPASIPLMNMCDYLNRKKINVVLQGDGGDELFAGYKRYQFLYSKCYLLLKIFNLPFLRIVFNKFSPRLKRVVSLSKEPFDEMSALLLTEETKENNPFDLLNLERKKFYKTQTDPFKEYKIKNHDLKFISSKIDRQMLIDLQIQLPTQFLPKVDLASMAAGVEARVPLLDEEVLRASFYLKTSKKTSFYWQNTSKKY